MPQSLALIVVLAFLLTTPVTLPTNGDARQATAAPPSLEDVMRRVGAYVDAYGERASIVVATEHYTQQAKDGDPVPTTRRIVADFAIVKVDALRGWQGYRDVVEVDGKRLPDRDDRLVRLLTAAGGRYDEARRLSDESARFNIGAITRNFNLPTTALFFFTRSNLDRFKFSAKGIDPGGRWEIAYEETSQPTMIQTAAGDPLPCKGRLWVNPVDGTVVRTRLDVEGFSRGSHGRSGIAQVDVTYRYVDALQMSLPASMDDDYSRGRGLAVGSSSGRAVYSNYRQFTTSGRIK